MSTTSAEVLKLLSAKPPKQEIAQPPTPVPTAAPATAAPKNAPKDVVITVAAQTPVATAAPVTAVPKPAPKEVVIAIAAQTPVGQTVPAQQPVFVEPAQESLEKITTTQQQISLVKDSLIKIIDSIASDQSILDRAAQSYGSIPLWGKIVAAVGVVPPALAGALTSVGMLFALSIYTGTGYLLDDHHKHKTNLAERLKAAMCTLTDILQLTINALEDIRKQLKSEVDKFASENVKLQKNVDTFESQLNTLGPQLELYKVSQALLQKTKEAIEANNKKLDSSNVEQAKLLKLNQEKLAKVTTEYNEAQKLLAAKIVEFDTAKESMSKEMIKAKKIAATLQGTLVTLTGSVIADPQKQQVFQQKLDTFLSDKEANFMKLSTDFTDTEKELIAIKDQLKASNALYADLLSRYEVQVKRLEADAVRTQNEAALIKPSIKYVEGLGVHGIYPGKIESPHDKTLPVSLGLTKHFEPTDSIPSVMAVVS